MKQLLDAFLQLPTWQGILLITGFVAIETGICLLINFLAYWRGRLDSDADQARRFQANLRERASILR